MKKISIGVCCYNEEKTIEKMYRAIKNQMEMIASYDYEIVFADNCSTDGSREILRRIASEDRKVKVILNQRNFGIQQSGYNMMSHLSGDAYIAIPCDFQDPPEMIPTFIEGWEDGYDLVWGQKTGSKENHLLYLLRTLYYKIIKFCSDTPQYEQVTGFGIQDMKVVKRWLAMEEPTISLRNIVGAWGYRIKLVPYVQNRREAGKSSYSIGKYLTFAINSMVNTSYFPLRMITLMGFLSATISFVVGIIYLIYKLTHWKIFNAGIAPLVIGIFFLGSVQLLSLGVIGEYLGVVLRRVTKAPKVIEEELINFEE